MLKISKIPLIISLFVITACGGSSQSGLLIEGTLTEAGGADHSKSIILKHEDGEKIGEVTICALGECSTTDSEGQWGFVLGDNFVGGEVLFTISGHNISANSVISIPEGATDVFLDLQHTEGGLIKAEHIIIDGVTQHNEDEDHQHK